MRLGRARAKACLFVVGVGTSIEDASHALEQFGAFVVHVGLELLPSDPALHPMFYDNRHLDGHPHHVHGGS